MVELWTYAFCFRIISFLFFPAFYKSVHIFAHLFNITLLSIQTCKYIQRLQLFTMSLNSLPQPPPPLLPRMSTNGSNFSLPETPSFFAPITPLPTRFSYQNPGLTINKHNNPYKIQNKQ